MMARGASLELEGMKEADAALGELTKAVARNTLRRVLRLAAAPVYDAIRERTPVHSGQLRDSVQIITPKVSKRGPFAEIDVANTDKRHAHLQEFGTEHHAANPSIVPGWEATKGKALRIVERETLAAVTASVARVRKRAAKRAAKAGV